MGRETTLTPNTGNTDNQGLSHRTLLKTQRLIGSLLRKKATMDSPVSHEPASHRLEKIIGESPDRYFGKFLAEIAAATAAEAAQVWGLSKDGRMVKAYGRNSSLLQPLDHPDVLKRHQDLLSRTLFEGKRHTSSVQLPHSQPETSQFLLLAPLKLDGETIGVLEMILPSQLNPTQDQLLEECLTHASRYLQASAMRNPENAFDGKAFHRASTSEKTASTTIPSAFSDSEVEAFIWSLHQHDNWASTASAIVNETRRLLGCDRVSLAIPRNRSESRIAAVSGQDVVVNRSNTIRAIQKIADHVLKSGQSIEFEIGDSSSHDPPARIAIDYLKETEALGFQAIPLLRPSKPDFDHAGSEKVEPPYAVLFIEQFSDSPDFAQGLSRLTPHISQAAFQSLQHDQIFMRPTRQAIGRLLQHSKTGKKKAMLICGTFLLLLALLCFGKATYSIKAPGKLMPAKQFRAYSPFDGEVQNVWVASGQAVKQGQPLLSLYDEQVATRQLTLSNSLAQKQKMLAAHTAQIDHSQASLSMAERIELNAQIAQTKSEIQGINLEIESLQRLIKKAEIRSEISGTMATFRPTDLLNGRPVSRGDLLLEVMNEDGPWVLELQIPTKRYGHLMREYQTNQSTRPVTFVLATDPEREYEATIKEVSSRAYEDEQAGGVFQLRAGVLDDEHCPHAIGADVTASIDCGQQPLGYVLFGDIIDWVRMRIW